MNKWSCGAEGELVILALTGDGVEVIFDLDAASAHHLAAAIDDQADEADRYVAEQLSEL